MLVDAVASSKFITKSDELIEKIITLGTPSSRPSLKRNLWPEGRIKQENERIYFNIEAVNQAINEGKPLPLPLYAPSRKRYHSIPVLSLRQNRFFCPFGGIRRNAAGLYGIENPVPYCCLIHKVYFRKKFLL